ncbi:MAG TPA: hypothetical protein PKA90_02710 [Ignavibacteria bacterium]|nr:hypothetical protein [Ignavibacteria bacterium]HMR39320.1 hypothetical protein [Ignavibacteria bacterium]
MKQLLQPPSLIMYLLAILVFDILGMSFAAITGAAKGQGLAGGAIVFMYGVYAAIAALMTALIFCYKADPARIKKANRILAIALVVLLVAITFRIFLMNGSNENRSDTSYQKANILTANYNTGYSPVKDEPDYIMGLGFFKPDIITKKVLYFYGEQNLNKPVYEHSPDDSLVFKKTEISNYDLIYAPPWLLPEHYKLDYDIFYLKLISVGKDFVEVSVNDRIQKMSFLDRYAGEILYWPEFLLSVNSVELLPDTDQKIRIKPLDYAGEVNIKHDFLKPVLIQDEWMSVELYDENYTLLGKGWIQWKDDNKLLISYSLLS